MSSHNVAETETIAPESVETGPKQGGRESRARLISEKLDHTMSTNKNAPFPRRGRKAKKEPEFIRKVVTLSKGDQLSEERLRSHRKASLAR
jgi:hypothetical protein